MLKSAVYPSLELAECPYPFYDELRESCPVYEVPGRENEFVVTRHEDVRYVLGHPELFSNSTEHRIHPELADVVKSTSSQRWSKSAIAADPPEHTIQRKLIIPPFTPKRLREYEPMIQSIVDELIDNVIDDGRMEFFSQFANIVPIYVTCTIAGFPRDDLSKLQRWSLSEGTGAKYLAPESQAFQRAIGQEMAAYLEAAILERYENPTDDATSELIKAQVDRDGEINVPYLVAESRLLLTGGIITTAHMLATTMLLLLQNPSQMQMVRDDPSKIPALLEESMRLDAPVQWQPRRVVEDVELSGTQIPAGSTLIVVFASANQDETVFENAKAMDIGRRNVKSQVGFGYGPHFCLGAPLARLEGKIAFASIFRRLTDIRLDPAQNDFSHLESVTFRGPKAVHILFNAA